MDDTTKVEEFLKNWGSVDNESPPTHSGDQIKDQEFDSSPFSSFDENYFSEIGSELIDLASGQVKPPEGADYIIEITAECIPISSSDELTDKRINETEEQNKDINEKVDAINCQTFDGSHESKQSDDSPEEECFTDLSYEASELDKSALITKYKVKN